MNLITIFLLFIVIPAVLGLIVNVVALLLLVNADLLLPELARGGQRSARRQPPSESPDWK